MPRSFLIRKILGLDDGNYTNDDHLHDNGNSRKTIYSDDIVKIVSQGSEISFLFKLPIRVSCFDQLCGATSATIL